MEYTISEFAKKIGMTTYTLRYYEKEGLLLGIKRKNGRRVFRDEDFITVKMINCLKDTGMSIHEIKQYLVLCREGDATLKQRHDIILKQKDLLEERISSLQKNLKALKDKEIYYQKAVEAGTENFDKTSCNPFKLMDKSKKG